jgi:drug/metabolite transporter (DMT)-like permease
VLLAIAFAQRRIPPFRTRWKQFAVVGVVNSAIPFALFCYAEQHISASAGAVLNATSPFFAAIAGAMWLSQPITAQKVAGIVLRTRRRGRASSACSRGRQATTHCSQSGHASSRRSVTRSQASTPSAHCRTSEQVHRLREPRRRGAGMMPLLPFTTIPGPLTAIVLANVAGLAVGSTAIAYLIYFKLIADVGPQRALTVTFLIPLFGILWGALFLGEPLTSNLLLGGALVVAGTIVTVRAK